MREENYSSIQTGSQTNHTLQSLKFSGVREKNIDSKQAIHKHTVTQMFSL